MTTMATTTKRPDPTRAARKERARRRRWLAINRGHTRCQYRLGKSFVCHGLLETVVDRISGRTDLHCERCARRDAKLCESCPRPIVGKDRSTVRCDRCSAAWQVTRHERWYQRNRETVLPKQIRYNRRVRKGRHKPIPRAARAAA